MNTGGYALEGARSDMIRIRNLGPASRTRLKLVAGRVIWQLAYTGLLLLWFLAPEGSKWYLAAALIPGFLVLWWFDVRLARRRDALYNRPFTLGLRDRDQQPVDKQNGS